MSGILFSFSKSMLTGFDALVIGKNPPSHSEIYDEDSAEPIRERMDYEATAQRLDSKAGALLTHISMMVAAASFVISSDDTHVIEEVVIGIEIIAYLFLALCCIRCLYFRGIPDKLALSNSRVPKDYLYKLEQDNVRAATYLNFVTRWAFLLTFVFALSIVLHIIL